MNLYSNLVPAGRSIVVVQSGFAVVYLAADRAGADAVFQPPSCEMDPTILTVCPYDVVVLELNVTATVATGVAQPAAAVVDEVCVEVGTRVADDVVLLDDGPPLDDPVILMSAQLRYTCGVWNEFHRIDNKVWFDA
jgi:hypothetical protein